ncbi:MAG TPA: hypothetical protein VH234_02800 [Candidatus Saccharimonadales bacterium]|jgi:hypothetical protein|nr:hypothetical protein [Candidatus Saccharimonadales bacterium]
MNKYGRKISAGLYILLITLIPNVYAALFIHGSHGHKYDAAGTILWIFIPIFAALSLLEEFTRQKSYPNTTAVKRISFAIIYTLLLLFVGAGISAIVALAVFGPSSF